MADRTVIIPEGLEAQYTRFHYAPAVRVGEWIHASGVIGTEADHSISPDPSTQFDRAFANIGVVLNGAGASFANIVSMTSFHVGLNEHLRAFSAAKDRFVGEPYPAWTAIGCTELAFPGALVEVQVVAYIAPTTAEPAK